MKVVVRKCRFTGEIFEEHELDKYRRHLKDLRAHMAFERKRAQDNEAFSEWLRNSRESVKTLDEIPAWIISNSAYLMPTFNKLCCDGDSWNSGEKFYPSDEIKSIDFINAHYVEDISVKYFHQKPNIDFPEGEVEDGYTGRVECSLSRIRKHNSRYPMRRFLSMLGVYTGSGGGGNERSAWAFYICLAEWPGIRSTVTATKLAGNIPI